MSSSNRPSKRPSSVKAPSALASPRRGEVAAPARGDRAPASGDQRFPPAAASQPRPPGPRLLSQVELDEDEVLIDAFDATLDGVRVRITAVLERTCVYVDRDGDRRLARKNDLWVEADKLPIRRRSAV